MGYMIYIFESGSGILDPWIIPTFPKQVGWTSGGDDVWNRLF